MQLSLFRKVILGAGAALIAWAIQAALLLTDRPLELRYAILFCVFGGLVSAAVAATEGYYEIDHIEWNETMVALLSGALVAALAGWGMGAFFQTIQGGAAESRAGAHSSGAAFYGAWVLAGMAIGIASSLRIRRYSNERVRNGFIGGILGGVVGAALIFVTNSWTSSSSAQAALSAAGFAAVGGAIALWIGLLPGWAATAVLEFIDSDHTGVRHKWGALGNYPLGKGRYVVGSSALGAAGDLSVVLIPDDKLPKVHSFILYQDGEYQVVYPEDNKPGGTQSLPIRTQAGGIVPDGGRLRNGSILSFGSTKLRFHLKREA